MYNNSLKEHKYMNQDYLLEAIRHTTVYLPSVLGCLGLLVFASLLDVGLEAGVPSLIRPWVRTVTVVALLMVTHRRLLTVSTDAHT